MSALCATVCKSSGLLGDNRRFSTEQETTKLQDVLTTHRVYTGSNPVYAGLEVANPQSTALITVISYIEEFPHSITSVSAKQLHITSEAKS